MKKIKGIITIPTPTILSKLENSLVTLATLATLNPRFRKKKNSELSLQPNHRSQRDHFPYTVVLMGLI